MLMLYTTVSCSTAGRLFQQPYIASIGVTYRASKGSPYSMKSQTTYIMQQIQTRHSRSIILTFIPNQMLICFIDEL